MNREGKNAKLDFFFKYIHIKSSHSRISVIGITVTV